VIPRELIAVAEVPGGSPLQLVRHGGDFMITLERNELMSTRMRGSEIALGTLTCERLGTAAPKVLIGGYGMGFTLRAVLGALGPAAQVTVAELVPEIVEWARGPMHAMTDDCLDDPRVELKIGDVAGLIDPRAATWDAILLDVDNGPDGLTREANDGLYSARGLDSARSALRSGGVLAVWSAAQDPAFARRLARVGFAVEEVRVRARENGKGPLHTLWFATKA
jgi:spermidine synthase